jgi:hypothetical protein
VPLWLSPRYWKLTARLSSQREYLALLLWPFLPEIRLASAPDNVLNWRVIAGNSLYLFLPNDEKEVVIVPLEQVASVRYRQPQPQ